MNLARVAAGAALVTVLSIGCASAKPAKVSADVNLRKAPNTDSEILTLIPKGTKVDVGKCTNGWCQVSWNGQEGFAIAKNLGMARVRRPRGPGPGGEYEEDYGPPGPYGPGPYGPPGYYGDPYYPGPYWGPRYGWGPGWGRRRGW